MINTIKILEINLSVPCHVFSRVSGYYTPVYFGDKSANWNKGKQEEFNERRYLNYESSTAQMLREGLANRGSVGEYSNIQQGSVCSTL